MKNLFLKIIGRWSKRSWIIALLLISGVCASGIRLHVMFSAPIDTVASDDQCAAPKLKQETSSTENQKPIAFNCSGDAVIQKATPKPTIAPNKGTLVVQERPGDELVPQPYRTTIETTIVNRGQDQAPIAPSATNNSQQGTSPLPAESDFSRDYSYPSNKNYAQNYANKSDTFGVSSEQASKQPERSRSRSFIIDKKRDRDGVDDLNSLSKTSEREPKQRAVDSERKMPMTDAEMQRVHGEFNKQQSQQAVQNCKARAADFLQGLGRPA